ncbi:hypothetical protein LCGC14_1274600, partial [marine sediment metagenome]
TGMLVLRRKGRIFISGNSGKTSAAAMEIGLYKPIFLFKKYGIKETRWVVVRNCFDDKTEILTEKRGWVLFKDLKKDDKVASNVNGKTEYVNPTYYYQAPYNGEMIGIKSQNIDLLVTPNHHLWVSKRKTRKKIWNDYEQIKAEDIYGIGELNRMSSIGKWDGGKKTFKKAYFEFLGFWFAEGYAGIYKRKNSNGYHYRLSVIQNKRKDMYVEKLLAKNGFKFSICKKASTGNAYNYSFSIESNSIKELISELSGYGKAKTKYLPHYIKNAPATYLRAFLKGYQEGDGSFKNGHPNKCDILFTASRQLADDLQEIIFKSGKCSVINLLKTGNDIRGYTITIRTKHRSYPIMLKQHWSKQDYNGKVYCIEVPSHVIYVRRNGTCVWSMQSYIELTDTTLRTVREWFPGAEYFEKSKYGSKVMFIEHPKYGIRTELLFRSCDNPDDVKKFKSLELTGYWIDESIEVDENIKKMLKNRLGRFPKKCPVRFGIETTNPPDVEHPTYSQFQWNVPPPGPKPKIEPLVGHYGFWQPPYENAENLRPGYYDDLRNDYKDDPDWADMYIDGKPGIIIKGKLIYNNYRRDIHESKKSLVWKGGRLIRGWDNSGNIPAAVVLQTPTEENRTSYDSVQVLREFTTDRENIEDFAKRVVMVCNSLYPNAKYLDFGDPAGDNQYSKGGGGFTSNSQIMLEGCGVNVYPSEQNLTMRITSVENLLKRIDGLLIDPSCVRLLNGFLGGYNYPKIGSTEWYSDKPAKNRFSHCLVGETLVSTPFGKKRIDKIKVGNIVNTHKGPKIVTATMNSISNQLVKISIDDGNSLTCTNNHPIAKDYNCFSRADALHYGNGIIGEKFLWDDLQNTEYKNSTVLSFIGNLMDITKQIGEKIKAFTCMLLFGNSIKERFQKVITYITKIITSQIIELKISNYYLYQNTNPIMVKQEYCSIRMLSEDTWKKSDHWQQRGIVQKKDEYQARKQQRQCGKKQRRKIGNALSAVNNTKVLEILEGKISVLLPASKKIVGILVWIMKKEYAYIVKNLFKLQNTPKQPHVQNIVPKNSDSVKVYDLTVEDSHTFYANGILVGNCHDALQYAIVRIFQSIDDNDDDWDEDEYDITRDTGRSKVTGY